MFTPVIHYLHSLSAGLLNYPSLLPYPVSPPISALVPTSFLAVQFYTFITHSHLLFFLHFLFFCYFCLIFFIYFSNVWHSLSPLVRITPLFYFVFFFFLFLYFSFFSLRQAMSIQPSTNHVDWAFHLGPRATVFGPLAGFLSLSSLL